MRNGQCPHWKFWSRALLCSLLCLPISALTAVPEEYDVKLVYLYNFTKFLNWPESAFADEKTAFSICLLGRLPSSSAIDTLEQKQSRNRPIRITRLKRNQNIDDCHIVFLTKHVDYADVTLITRDLTDPILVVGETAGFAKHHGDIGFVVDDRNHVRIEVNLARANNKNIAIRAQLLEIARNVYRGDGAL